jgi:hypothetical protein
MEAMMPLSRVRPEGNVRQVAFGRQGRAESLTGPAASGCATDTAVPALVRCSKVELVRMLAADLIEKIAVSDEPQRLLLFMQLRNVQDSIASMKHQNALMAARSSPLEWVDSWTPVER